MWSETELALRGIQPIIIGYAHLRDRRTRKMVPLGPGGVLTDYVPAFFGARPPMLYVIKHGHVDEFTGSQAEVVFLVASAEAFHASGIPFVFTDGHAVVDISSFFDDLADLNHIDWPLMESKYWNDTLEDGDRLRRRQAEFLVHRFLPWNQIREVAVLNIGMQQKVQAYVSQAAHQPSVEIRPSWYY